MPDFEGESKRKTKGINGMRGVPEPKGWSIRNVGLLTHAVAVYICESEVIQQG